jgi:hypothetical protein
LKRKIPYSFRESTRFKSRCVPTTAVEENYIKFDVLGEYITSIFRVEKSAEKETSV